MVLREGGKIHTLKHQKKKKNLSFSSVKLSNKIGKMQARGLKYVGVNGKTDQGLERGKIFIQEIKSNWWCKEIWTGIKIMLLKK